MTDSSATLAQLWALIQDIRFAMFTTQAGDGLRSRPLTTQNDDEHRGRELYFFVDADSEVARDATDRPDVNVAYADPDGDRYVSIQGRARRVEDPGLARALWSPMAEAWFDGPDDPGLAVLAVEMEGAELWNVTDSKATQLFKMARAAVAGGRPGPMGEHREVRLD
jgi:general stress protein 26